MTDNKFDFKFAPLAVENVSPVSSVRLVAEGKVATLAIVGKSQDGVPELKLVPISGGKNSSRALFPLTSPFGAPSWDLARHTTGFAAAWTKPGSAISQLGYQNSGGEEVKLTGRYPAGVFQSPRFVRGAANSEPAVTAVMLQSGSYGLVLFPSALESGKAVYQTLPSIATGFVQEGLLLRSDSDYLLVVRMLQQGNRAPDRKDARGESLPPGVLVLSRLNAKLEAVGPVVKPLGDTPVYEFDCDLIDGGIFLLATTQTGYATGRANIAEPKLQWVVSPIPTKEPFVSPSLLALANTVHGVVLDVSSASPRVLIGSINAH
ncbi:MAG TPA: hypothetical protein VJP02_06430 [Candidatus Sulfotelmatobacter sp.]|nr:hypothetical protein [Candidatus Sulfotelmatobacter sp.]